MKTEEITREITSTTPITAVIAGLVTRLSGDDAALLFICLTAKRGATITLEFAENIDRLRNENIITKLSINDVALLVGGAGAMPPALEELFQELMDRLRGEQLWEPLLQFLGVQNQHLHEELEWYLNNIGADDDEGDGGRGLDLALKPQPQPQNQDDDDEEDNRLSF